jgi:hypothetical protein
VVTLRKHAWAIRFTLVAYLVFASVGTAMGCLCCCSDTHVKQDCDHSDCSGVPRETASSKESVPHHHSGGEKPSAHDHAIHCPCQFCAVTGTNYTHAVNALASTEFNGPVAAGWFTSVAPSVEILTTSLSPPGPSVHMPVLISALQSVVLLI